MTNGIRDNDAGDGATADRIANELCPADRTNPTWRYLVRQAVLKGIQAERARTWRAERASRTPPADAVALLNEAADLMPSLSYAHFATRLRTAADALAGVGEDTARLDWLEANAKPHHGVIVCGGDVPGEEFMSLQRVDQWRNPHKVEWCHEAPTLRATIDAARAAQEGTTDV